MSLILTGCTSSPATLVWSYVPFPPQKVLASGNYVGFLAENERNLKECGTWTPCDVALFNLCFVYAYPESPYRNPRKAKQYLDELQRRYPQSPWTSQGQVLMAFIQESASLERAQRRLQAELRTREATIQKLQGQLHRSREIDIEIEKKTRELLR